MSHTCEAIIIHCMDFRLHPQISTELPKLLKIESFDLVGIAGVAKNLLEEGSDKECLMKQISLSSDLHGIKSVVLVNHLDCGAYGGSFEGEFTKHSKDMNKAAEVIMEQFPDLQVIKVIAKPIKKGDKWVTEFEKVE